MTSRSHHAPVGLLLVALLAGAWRSLPPPAPLRVRPSPARKHDAVVDLNRASDASLQDLPGVGPALARRIIAGRPYASVDELRRVRGIGPRTLLRLRPRVTVLR